MPPEPGRADVVRRAAGDIAGDAVDAIGLVLEDLAGQVGVFDGDPRAFHGLQEVPRQGRDGVVGALVVVVAVRAEEAESLGCGVAGMSRTSALAIHVAEAPWAVGGRMNLVSGNSWAARCLPGCCRLPVDSGGEQASQLRVEDAGAKPVRGAYRVADGLWPGRVAVPPAKLLLACGQQPAG